MIANSRILAKEEQVSCDFQVMDAEHLSFQDESFDVVISRNLTWTLPEAAQAYKEWTRVLKPGGLLLNLMPTMVLQTLPKPPAFRKSRPQPAWKFPDAGVRRYQTSAAHQFLPPPGLGRGRAWKTGMEQISIDLGLSRRVYKEKDEFYNPTPMFAIAAKKA